MNNGRRSGRGQWSASGPVARADAGMVTAELAVAMPALVLAGLLAMAGIQLTSAQLRCLDAAGVAARLAARGEVPADVQSAARAAAPGGAEVTVSDQGDLVSAVVIVSVHPLGLGRLLPPFTVRAAATEPAEPGTASASPGPP